MIEVKTGQEWMVRLQDGDDLMGALGKLESDAALILAGIGMVRDAQLGYWNGSEYEIHTYPDPMELVSMQGNLAIDHSGQRIVHAHISLAARDGAMCGGHLVKATAHNTVEIGLLPLRDIALERRPESSGLVGLFPIKL
ncbi:DUF296 domain-containing protein [Candidatus Bipolaricaulota bacterium]|jgi:predicted DNA-binding protein with PD1-like motif|nr:DUF296 domain-containing protein [Candidatus Bipolaricaulota bacterium]TFH07347.1 MAG: DNA-binding protein [Candidatus Atribacteria bacterium]